MKNITKRIIRGLGGIVPDDLPKDVAERLEDEGIAEPPEAGEAVFIGEPGAEEEEDALEEIHKPKWKRFFDNFKTK